MTDKSLIELRAFLACEIECGIFEGHVLPALERFAAAAPQSPAIAAERVAELERDAARLDWLADPENMLGSVGLPRECVEPNIHSMREAIDMAMAMDAAIAKAGERVSMDNGGEG